MNNLKSNFDQRIESTKKAETAVIGRLRKRGWSVSNYKSRLHFNPSHHDKLIKLKDPMSLFIRHFPDHVATKGQTILVQTKWAEWKNKRGEVHDAFVMEKDCAEAMPYYPYPTQIVVVYWIEEVDEFWAASGDKVVELIMDSSPQTSKRGSSLPFYSLKRSEFVEFDKLMGEIEKGGGYNEQSDT